MQLSSRNAYNYTIQQSFPLAPEVNIKMVSLRKQDLTSGTWLCFVWFLNRKATQIKKFFFNTSFYNTLTLLITCKSHKNLDNKWPKGNLRYYVLMILGEKKKWHSLQCTLRDKFRVTLATLTRTKALLYSSPHPFASFPCIGSASISTSTLIISSSTITKDDNFLQ